MRFGVPRSPSPSPARRRRRSAFGVPRDSDSSSDSDSGSESDSDASVTSSDSFCYASESEVPQPSPSIARRDRSVSQQHDIEDMVASIRLRATHSDPYEEWERQTRKDAFLAARQSQTSSTSLHQQNQLQSSHMLTNTQASQHARQLAEVESRLNAFKMAQQNEERRMREAWKERDRMLWERIERVIKGEEDKARAQLEVQRKKREEEERRRQEEERKRSEELERKRKAEEERKRKEEEEQKERERQGELQKKKQEQEQAEIQERTALGMTTTSEDWQYARETLLNLKACMKLVKADKSLKTFWNAGRRAITPKIGQLTNDARAINQITEQLLSIIRNPSQPSDPNLYLALLSSLAKAILLQAETEVTAEKRSALPLAQCTTNLLSAVPQFGDILYAKLVQRGGGWPIPCAVPATDVGGEQFTSEQRRKVLGYREGEVNAEYTTRVAGIMRVYFQVLVTPLPEGTGPLPAKFRLPRSWTWFARMLSQPQILEAGVAAELLHVALDVFGANLLQTYGGQWVKLLAVLYEGVTVGIQGTKGKSVGGSSPEGTAARMRVQLEIERIMA